VHLPKISIIIPTYNSQDFITRCLDSLLNQSVKNYEILIVDDQSTDSTLEILGAYAKKYPVINVNITPEKVYAGGARNKGVALAKGEYISFVDSDDWIDTNYLKKLLDKAEEDGLDFALAGVRREYESARESCIRYAYTQNNVIDGRYALKLMSRVIDQDISISSIVCNKLFRADFIRSHNLFFSENSINEDDVFMFEACLAAKKIGIVSAVNYHQHQRKGSVSRNFTKKNIDDLISAFIYIRDIVIKKYSCDDCLGEFYSFFEKCLAYIIETLTNSVQDDTQIMMYYKYLLQQFFGNFDWSEYIEYCGTTRLERFFIGDYMSHSKYSRQY